MTFIFSFSSLWNDQVFCE